VKPGVVFVEFLPVMRTEDLTLADRHSLCEQVEQAVFLALAADQAGSAVGAGFEPKDIGR
jgi:hypothetical protein